MNKTFTPSEISDILDISLPEVEERLKANHSLPEYGKYTLHSVSAMLFGLIKEDEKKPVEERKYFKKEGEYFGTKPQLFGNVNTVIKNDKAAVLQASRILGAKVKMEEVESIDHEDGSSNMSLEYSVEIAVPANTSRAYERALYTPLKIKLLAKEGVYNFDNSGDKKRTVDDLQIEVRKHNETLIQYAR